jgi:L-rhamnose mutarotase
MEGMPSLYTRRYTEIDRYGTASSWIKITMFWDVTSYHFAMVTNILEEPVASIFYHDDGSSNFLQNGGIFQTMKCHIKKTIIIIFTIMRTSDHHYVHLDIINNHLFWYMEYKYGHRLRDMSRYYKCYRWNLSGQGIPISIRALVSADTLCGLMRDGGKKRMHVHSTQSTVCISTV